MVVEKRTSCELRTEVSGHESLEFKSHFLRWDNQPSPDDTTKAAVKNPSTLNETTKLNFVEGNIAIRKSITEKAKATSGKLWYQNFFFQQNLFHRRVFLKCNG